MYLKYLYNRYPDLAQLLNTEMITVFAKDYDSSLGLL